MLIGNQYADNKLFRGIKHYDSLPLTSGDLHEYADTESMKNAYLMNNIIGYGVLNTPNLSISSTGIKINTPAVILLDGDISLVHSDNNLATLSEIASAGYTNGSICIVGWYQHLTANDTIHAYGGIDNPEITNPLTDNAFNVQVSTRYQFVWTKVLINSSALENNSITFNLPNRDKQGVLTTGSSSITTTSKINSTYLAPAPSSMDYSVSGLYVIPLLKYEYSNDSVSTASNYLPVTPKGTAGFIEKSSAPTGEYNAGTTWYNPITGEFKIYVEGRGFIENAAKMGYLQYQSAYRIPATISTPQDILVNINIDTLAESDILTVYYEGLALTKNEHYTVNYNTKVATLKNFTVEKDDLITFNAIKIVEANDISNITTTFNEHLLLQGSPSVRGHVRLSDTLSDSNELLGTAATPKLVKDAINEATKISDGSNQYKLGIDNGILYIEEM